MHTAARIAIVAGKKGVSTNQGHLAMGFRWLEAAYLRQIG
jgi:hypothetical protein